MAINYTKWPLTIPNGQKYTKWTQNKPNGYKIYQMATKYTERQQNKPNGRKIDLWLPCFAVLLKWSAYFMNGYFKTKLLKMSDRSCYQTSPRS
jgi:hypothetical protein